MRAWKYISLAVALVAPASFAQADVITIRTGQVASVPGTCPGLDDSFRVYAPQTQCGIPVVSAPFSGADFAAACDGLPAPVITAYPGFWAAGMDCDPLARWISSAADASCFGSSVSALFCAHFDAHCEIADSVKVCWLVDDFLGDQPSWPGPNPDGVYLNGVSLGPAFTAGNPQTPTTAVAYNVPLVNGSNSLQVYQRDAGCAVSGLMLSCTVYTTCGSVPVEEQNWGRIKSLYR
jgi:hypothetical protein